MGHIFSRTPSTEQALLLDKDVSDEEIFASLKSMQKNKSPGPDGFNVNFFTHNWDIVGKDFLTAIKSFFFQWLPPEKYKCYGYCSYSEGA